MSRGDRQSGCETLAVIMVQLAQQINFLATTGSLACAAKTIRGSALIEWQVPRDKLLRAP